MSEPQLTPNDLALEPSILQPIVETTAWSASDAAIVCAFAAGAFLIHLLTANRYGYFRDELYYAACGQHLAWGYVDHAPLVAVICWFARRLLGDSLYAMRLFPALSAAAKVLFTAWMVREFGGRRFAYLLAAVVVFFCPIYLTMDSFLSMNSFEPLFWMGCVAVAMRIAKGGSPRLWLLFGAIAGVGILNKHSTLFFGLAFFLSLLITSGTRYLRNVWIWLGALIAFLIFLPNLLWEIGNRFPTIEVLRECRSTQECACFLVRLHRGAGPARSSFSLPRGSGGTVVLSWQQRRPRLPLSWMDLSSCSHADDSSERPHLLRRANLSHVVCRRRRMDREPH